MERVRPVTVLADANVQQLRPVRAVAPQTIQAGTMMEIRIVSNERRDGIVDVMAIVAGARAVAEAVEWKTVASAGSRCRQRR